ncbi:MAG: TrkH family potassium uptake protein [Firmicutes bacterium]|nr:TrkH family potassium uptake protein [Bacillota bacterium]
MNYGIVRRVLGNILKIEAALMLIPIGLSLVWQEFSTASAFIWSALITLAVGIVLGTAQADYTSIRIREALLIVTLTWVSVAVFAALPYLFTGTITDITKALFESVSALTTTGATVIDDVENLPRGLLFWRSLTLWIGGMGILVLSLTILPTLGVSGLQIYKAELPGPVADKIVPKLADTAKILYFVYGGMTALLTVLLIFGGLNFFEALQFSFSTVSTGGFSIYNTSITRFSSNNFVMFIISGFMILSGVNFSLFYNLRQGRFRRVMHNTELRFYAALLGIAAVAVTLNLYQNVFSSLFDALKHALLQVSSIITTTGFASTNFDQWPAFSKLILFLLMFTGASAGSTTGAIKLIRVIIAGKFIKREIAQLFHSHAVVPITINGQVVPDETIRSVCAFLFLYFAVFAVSSVLLALEGVGMVSAASAAAAALGNVGTGFGVVGPTHNYSQFSPAATGLLTILMLLGRLELFAMIAIFTPSFWKQ